jgi:hypothetical protein
MQFRWVAGWFCLAVAVTFLGINSNILARGAARWAMSDWDRFSYGTIAATIPWVLGLMPFLIAYTWKAGKRTGRPTMLSLIGMFVWVVFAAYNIIGAGGAISFIRNDVISERQHGADTQKDRKDQREALAAQRAAIPKSTRPAGTVDALIVAEKAKRYWDWTDGCRSTSNSRERAYCEGIANLQAEAAAARVLVELTTKIGALDAKMETAGPVSEKVDPQASWLAKWTPVSEQTWMDVLPLLTPAVLEIGSLTFASFGIWLLGWNHRSAFGPTASMMAPATGITQEPLGYFAGPTPPSDKAKITRQIELARWFFSECSRPVAAGALTEAEWYSHYRAIMARSNDEPLALEVFREVARKVIPSVRQIEGIYYYERVLPMLPQNAA